jgi:hypothetical protein
MLDESFYKPSGKTAGFVYGSDEKRKRRTEITEKGPIFEPLAPLEEEQGHFIDVLAHGSKEALLCYSDKPSQSCVAKSVKLLPSHQ